MTIVYDVMVVLSMSTNSAMSVVFVLPYQDGSGVVSHMGILGPTCSTSHACS
jgi:hypothetical protein